MGKALVAAAAIFAVMAGWLWVQRMYASFARSHPELGPFRDADGGCGGGCSCGKGSCERD